jgi:glycosyltransferase involved in cell wall biosynthesis
MEQSFMPSPLVFHVIPSLRMGGAERLVVELAARLPDRGFRTRIVALFDRGALWREVRERNITWVQVMRSVRSSRPDLVLRLGKMFFAEPGRRPHIVHTHLFGADFWSVLARDLFSARFFLRERRVPRTRFISTAHNVDRDDSSVRRFARRWAARRMDRVIAISKEVETYARRDLGVPARRLEIIPNGADLDRIRPRGSRPFSDVPRFITVGRLEPQKGHDTLLRALAGVPPPWRLDIVGTGSLERDLRELAERMHIASRVHFLGERNDVPDLLAASDLFLFPSRWEGMGLALLEAMAAGVPALASDLPAIREFAPARSLVRPDDPAAWSRAVSRALAASSELIARAPELERRVRRAYGINRMVDAYAETYENMMNIAK